MVILPPTVTVCIFYFRMEEFLPDFSNKSNTSPPNANCTEQISLIKKASLLSKDLKNYDPVSGLYFMSKLVDHVDVKQLMQYINSNSPAILSSVQFYTETAVLHIKNEIHLSLSRGEPTALVLLDLSVASNTIDHNSLLNF